MVSPAASVASKNRFRPVGGKLLQPRSVPVPQVALQALRRVAGASGGCAQPWHHRRDGRVLRIDVRSGLGRAL